MKHVTYTAQRSHGRPLGRFLSQVDIDTFSNIPLISHDFTVMNVKTTGFDPLISRPIEIGALHIKQSQIREDTFFEERINPHQPIIPLAMRSHGLRDQDIIHAPDFSVIKPKLDNYIGNDLIVTHNGVFDLTILKQSAQNNDLKWHTPRGLCIMLLARLVAPMLPDYSLQTLAKWMGLARESQQQALEDARLIAKLFLTFVPLLQSIGIRTLAQAENASLSVLNKNSNLKAEWISPIQKPLAFKAQASQQQSYIDDYLYRVRCKTVMASDPVIVKADLSLRECLDIMTEKQTDAAFVVSKQNGIIEYGILTERNILRSLRLNVEKGLVLPVQHFMNYPIHTIQAEAFAYQALGRMQRFNLQHLAVMNTNNELVGVMTPDTLLVQRAKETLLFSDDLEDAKNEPELSRVWARLPKAILRLVHQGCDIFDLTRLISQEIRLLITAASQMAENRMLANKRGPAPCEFCVFLLGPAARDESLLNIDQYHAIIYDGNRTHDVWFEEFADHLSQILSSAGLSPSKSRIMSQESDWRQPLSVWKKSLKTSMETYSLDQFTRIEAFLDAYPVYGSIALGQTLYKDMISQAAQQLQFQSSLSSSISQNKSGFNFFGQLKGQDDHIDLEKHAIIPLSALARVLAVKYETMERQSIHRLREAHYNAYIEEQDFKSAVDAYRTVLEILLVQQLGDIAAGRSAAHLMDTKQFSTEAKADVIQSLKDLDKLRQSISLG